MQNKPSTFTVAILTAGCFLAFFVFGFTDNLKGPTLPAMLTELHINYGTGGNIFFGEYIGFFIATLITGILADRFGLKLVVLLAGLLMALGVSGYSFFRTALPLAGSLFVIGLGLGALELGPNAIIVSLHHERKGLFLNLMSVLHGLGSMLAPLFAGWLFSLNFSWRVAYRWDLLLVALFVFLFLFLRFPKTKEKTQLDFREVPNVAFKENLPWFYLAIGSYVAVEIGIASWLVTFLQQARGFAVISSNRGLSLFFAAIMIGRFIGGFVVHRIGYLRSILCAAIGATLCIAAGLFITPIILPLAGFFMSIIFPTITAAVSDSHHENGNTILGMLFTFAGIGGLIGPWLVAWGSDLLGLQTGLSITLILAALLVASIFILWKGEQNDSAT